MEDQVMSLQKLNVETALFNAQTTREESKQIMTGMVDPNSNLKLIYVTPEKLAKSKMIMSQMEKMYSLGRFSRLVIDEVHCCSQWGHDFRKDYKFLGIMKNQFPDVPILGLTATATFEVIQDIQKILNIEGCLVLKSSFYRPNLKYEIINSTTKDDGLQLAEMIKTKFRGQSGIVYCLTVRETENLAKKLQKCNLRASAYNAQISPQIRSKIHEKWYSGVIQVIVATIAFGMGINKMDVRFVIHYSMSKSIENYYQETGRAGRDGKEANCILFFRFQDSFRVTSLFFTENNALRIIHKMIEFCVNREDCRKKLLARYFGDNDCECNQMCDNCINGLGTERLDITGYCIDILSILKDPKNSKERFTGLKLLDTWLHKGATKCRVNGVSKPTLPREVCESIIIQLIIKGYLKEEFHFTPYSTISYLVPGYKASLLGQEPLVIRIVTVASPGDGLKKSRSRLPKKPQEMKMKESPKSSLISSDDEPNESNESDESDESVESEDEVIIASVKKRPRILEDSIVDSSHENSDNSLICLE